MSEEGIKLNHIMQIRVDMPLWKSFRALCLRNDTTPSELVREFMRDILMVREEQTIAAGLDAAEEDLKKQISYTDVGKVAKKTHRHVKDASEEMWSL
jgi:hypothetical protein